jgi:hypothetical protein
LNINNFNAVFEILAGLQNAAIYRLKKTWDVCVAGSKPLPLSYLISFIIHVVAESRKQQAQRHLSRVAWANVQQREL